MKKILSIFLKFILICLMTGAFVLGISGFSPIYDFAEKRPFTGRDIFNPYRNLNAATTWKKANLHTHTRVEGLFNECPEWPEQVYEKYVELGYDVVVFSNHNAFTKGDDRPDSLKLNAYEHGYNLFRFHKLVFGSKKVMRLDNLLPLLASQYQWQFDKLVKNAELIQFNHPSGVRGIDRYKMERLSGYRLIELNSGLTDTGHSYWDRALSAGHYSFALANDDLHDSNTSSCIAKRCNFLRCNSNSADNVIKCLKDGCFYCMQMPDFGNGDREVKREMNRHLPAIDDIGVRDDSTVFIQLDRVAQLIVFTGQDARELKTVKDSTDACYTMKSADSYARITCHFSDGTVLYTNPFARYDKTEAATPFSESPHPVNVPLTILWNLLMVLICAGSVIISVRGISRR